MNQRASISNDQLLTSLLGEMIGGQPEEAGIDLHAYWQVVLKYKNGILTLTLLVGLLALIYTSTLVPRYQALASLLFDPPSASNYNTVRDITAMDAYNTYYRNSQVFRAQQEIMKSRKFAAELVDHYELWNHPHFVASSGEDLGEPEWKTNLKQWLPPWALQMKRWVPEWILQLTRGQYVSPPELSNEELRQRYRDAAMSAVQSGITIETDEEIMLIKLGFVSEDPEFAADMANKLADFYIQRDLDKRMQTFADATAWLTDRTAELRDNMVASEEQLQAFRERENLVSLDGANIKEREVEDIFERLTEARKKAQTLALVRSRMNTSSNSLSQLAGSPELIKYPGVRESLEDLIESQKIVDELGLVYGPRHPKMIDAVRKHQRLKQKLDSEKKLVRVSVEAELASARAQERRLSEDFNRIKNEMRETDRKQFKLGSLERNQQSDQELYNLFVTRFKELSIGSDVTSPNAQIIDYALVPAAPYWPNKPRLIFLYSAIALLLGIGLAFLREYLDKTIKTPEEVEDKLAVPLLGALAQLKISKGEKLSPERMFIDKNSSVFTESIRTIRTGIMLSGLDNPHKIIAITSTVPGEGKTTVSMNTACALGQLEKVLLIDADMRRAALGSHFGFPPGTPGLADVVAGIKTLGKCIQNFEEGNIHILPAGTIPPNPQELLSSARFEKVLEVVSSHYDRIIIDTAPVHLVSDPKLVARWASALIYVVRAESTYSQLAAQHIRELNKVGKPLLGVVLNGVSEQRTSYRRYQRYGKNGYGNYGYGGNYGVQTTARSVEEKVAAESTAKRKMAVVKS